MLKLLFLIWLIFNGQADNNKFTDLPSNNINPIENYYLDSNFTSENLVEDDEPRTNSNSENEKLEAYNTRSNREIAKIPEVAIENAKPLIALKDLVSPSPTVSPTSIPTPTPPIIIPEPTPFDPCPPPPPCSPIITNYKNLGGEIIEKFYPCPLYPDVVCIN